MSKRLRSSGVRSVALLLPLLWSCGGTEPGGGSASDTSGAGASASAGSTSSAGAAGASSGGAAAGGSAAAGAPAGGAGNAGAGPTTVGAGTGGLASGGTGSGLLPAQVLDLTNWYLTLPTGVPLDPDDVYQPELATFSVDPYFRVTPEGDAVAFWAHCGGVTTKGAVYPRSELREMTNGGLDKAAWDVTSGKHTMVLTEAITHLPVVKPDMVAAQIHDADSDEIMIRLIGTRLFVEAHGQGEVGLLEPNYVLGTFYTAKIEAEGGHIRVYYNDSTTPAVDVENQAIGCYFKAGAYTHSNPDKGDEPTAFGEVLISSLEVTHE